MEFAQPEVLVPGINKPLEIFVLFKAWLYLELGRWLEHFCPACNVRV